MHYYTCVLVHAHADDANCLDPFSVACMVCLGLPSLFCLNFFIIIHDRSKASQIYHIFVLVIIEHLSLYLGQLNTLLPLTYGLWVVFLLNCFLDRFSIQDKKFYLFFYFLAGNGFTFCCFFISVLATLVVASVPRWMWSWSACWDY